MKSLTSSQNHLETIRKTILNNILCTQEDVIVVKGDRKINLFSNEEWEEE